MKKDDSVFFLPPCGMWFGPGLHDNQKFYLTRSGAIHTRWEPEEFSMDEELEDCINENLCNFVLAFGNFHKMPLAMWRKYALDELGIPAPLPDWQNKRNISFATGPDFAQYHASRDGAWIIKLLRRAQKSNMPLVIMYSDAAPEQSRLLSSYPNYLGYNFGEKNVLSFPETENLQSSAEKFIASVKAKAAERKAAHWGRLLTTSASFYFDYEIAAGTEVPVCEDFAFRNLGFSSALSRGLYRQYDLEFWGSHIAHEHYSWISFANPRKFPLLKASFFLKYMHGAKMIINESGHSTCRSQMAPDAPMLVSTPRIISPNGIKDNDPELYIDMIPELDEKLASVKRSSPTVQNYRRVLKEFYGYLKANGTPAGQPEAKIAVIKGRYDLAAYPGYIPGQLIGGSAAAAQRNPAYYSGLPEQSWDIIAKIFTPMPDILGGELNQFIPANPCGLFDIISFAGKLPDAETLKQYQLLIFPGWNSAAKEQYQLMLQYVRSGGTLILGLPQLSTDVDRKIYDLEPADLLFNGDISELCGAKIKAVRKKNVYWTVNGNFSDSGFKLSRRRGVFNLKLGEVEFTDPDIRVLVTDDENQYPVIWERRLGKGKVCFINCWNFPAQMDIDQGPGAMTAPEGMITELYRYYAAQTTPTIRITENGKFSQFVTSSYFPADDTVCLLNLDFDSPHKITLHSGGITETITLLPGEFQKFKLNSIKNKITFNT